VGKVPFLNVIKKSQNVFYNQESRWGVHSGTVEDLSSGGGGEVIFSFWFVVEIFNKDSQWEGNTKKKIKPG